MKNVHTYGFHMASWQPRVGRSISQFEITTFTLQKTNDFHNTTSRAETDARCEQLFYDGIYSVWARSLAAHFSNYQAPASPVGGPHYNKSGAAYPLPDTRFRGCRSFDHPRPFAFVLFSHATARNTSQPRQQNPYRVRLKSMKQVVRSLKRSA